MFCHKSAILWSFLKRGVLNTAKSEKFGMDHSWAHWIWFRKSQFEEQCEDHVLAISRERGLWDTPRIVIFGMDYPWEYLIIIQKEPIWMTMWGPCFGHKRAIFWQFLVKGDYGIHPELWNLACSIPKHIDYDSGRLNLKDHVCHKRAIFWPFLEKGDYGIHPELWNLAWNIPGHNV